jgi:hypothetical protein
MRVATPRVVGTVWCCSRSRPACLRCGTSVRAVWRGREESVCVERRQHRQHAPLSLTAAAAVRMDAHSKHTAPAATTAHTHCKTRHCFHTWFSHTIHHTFKSARHRDGLTTDMRHATRAPDEDEAAHGSGKACRVLRPAALESEICRMIFGWSRSGISIFSHKSS